MHPSPPSTAAANPYIRQHYSMLREVLTNVRWLKRACGTVLIANIVGGLALWVVKHPQTVGF